MKTEKTEKKKKRNLIFQFQTTKLDPRIFFDL